MRRTLVTVAAAGSLLGAAPLAGQKSTPAAPVKPSDLLGDQHCQHKRDARAASMASLPDRRKGE